ncbi:MAG TPA: hypothetical protein VFG59_06210 [Anaeromyxobacter sp.]|nr:hypothetical protein [Anaeromyxobacter sp.]
MKATPIVLLVLVGSLGDARADAGAQFDTLKALAGAWTGVAVGHGPSGKMPTRATYRVVSGGSAVMLTTDPGTKHEMVTLFHRDDDGLMATHYCAAQNQPRFRAQPSQDGKRLVFEFLDGTNLGAHPARMERLVIRVSDRNHHTQEWTYKDGDQETTMRFELARRKG